MTMGFGPFELPLDQDTGLSGRVVCALLHKGSVTSVLPGYSSIVNSILNFHIPLKTQSDENQNNVSIIQLCNSVF